MQIRIFGCADALRDRIAEKGDFLLYRSVASDKAGKRRIFVGNPSAVFLFENRNQAFDVVRDLASRKGGFYAAIFVGLCK